MFPVYSRNLSFWRIFEDQTNKPGMINFSNGNAFSFCACCDDRAPRIDDDGVSERSALGVVTTNLSRSNDVTLILNGSK
jgi:hypothetical protein